MLRVFKRPSTHYSGEIWKGRLHSENMSNVLRPLYSEGITGQFELVFEENSVTSSSSGKFRFQNVFRPHENEKLAFPILPVWTTFSFSVSRRIRPKRRNKARFSNTFDVVWTTLHDSHRRMCVISAFYNIHIHMTLMKCFKVYIDGLS